MYKNFFKSKRNTILTVAYTFLIALCFSVGFAIGHHNGQGLLTTPVAVSTEATEEPEPEAETEPPVSYRVVTEDGELRMYCDNGKQSRLITSDEISEGAFPKEDIAALQEGQMFQTQEEAMAFLENFVS